MDRKLSNEAFKLLEFLVEHKEIFSKNFSAGTISHWKSKLRASYINPLLEELSDFNLIKKYKGNIFRVPKYTLNLDEIEEFLDAKEDSIYTQEYRDALEDEIKKYNKFVITTAVMGKEINEPFVNSIRNYAKRNNALLLVLPCEDVASRGKKASSIELSSELNDFKVVFKDTYINKNLCLSAIKVSAKQINSLTGLDRLATSRNASIIMASPKVFLKYVPNMHYDIPHAIMSTGAITNNNYDTEKYMSKKVSVLAENDHTFGAVLVEVEDENIFHFRHVQASPYNSLTDMGLDYLPDGSVKNMESTVMVVGDSHVGYHDEDLYWTTLKTARDIGVSYMVLHDIFNGTSITHHDKGKGITRAIKAKENKLSLELEFKAIRNYLDNIEKHDIDIYIVESNHDQHLTRYLEEGRYITDPINYQTSLKLALAVFEKRNPLQYAIENLLNHKSDRIHWLKEDESFNVYGVELSIHGSKGSNGSRGSLQAFERGLGNCVTAHSHTACIIRNAFSVGTTSQMDMDYNRGLSNWTRTCCLIYNNGTKQLINFIPKGKEYKCRV
jgi:hypothetical protein